MVDSVALWSWAHVLMVVSTTAQAAGLAYSLWKMASRRETEQDGQHAEGYGLRRSDAGDWLLLIVAVYQSWCVVLHLAMTTERYAVDMDGREWFVARYVLIWLYAPFQLLSVALVVRTTWVQALKLFWLAFIFTSCAFTAASYDGVNPGAKWLFYALLGCIEAVTLYQLAMPGGWIMTACRATCSPNDRRVVGLAVSIIVASWIAYPIWWTMGEMTKAISVDVLAGGYAVINAVFTVGPALFLVQSDIAG